MNNRGQTLALFVILLPVLLLLLVLIIDIGKVIVEKLELNNINQIVLEYGLDNVEKENIYDEMLELVRLNKNDVDVIDINITSDKISLTLIDSVDFMFKKIVDINRFKIKSSYVGYIQDGEKRIERVGG